MTRTVISENDLSYVFYPATEHFLPRRRKLSRLNYGIAISSDLTLMPRYGVDTKEATLELKLRIFSSMVYTAPYICSKMDFYFKQ